MDALPARTLLDYFQFSARSGKPDLLVSKVNGTWTPVPGVTGNSATVPIGAGNSYFRLRK